MNAKLSIWSQQSSVEPDTVRRFPASTSTTLRDCLDGSNRAGPPLDKQQPPQSKDPMLSNKQMNSRVPPRRLTSDSLDPFREDEKPYGTIGPRATARERRLTLAAGSGDLEPMVSFSSTSSSSSASAKRITPLRSPLQRKDHLVKCPLTKTVPEAYSIRQKTIKRVGTHSSQSSSSNKKPAPGVVAAKRKARQIRRLRLFFFALSATVAITFLAVGYYTFKYGVEYIQERDEMIRQQVRDEELEPLLVYYQQQVNDLLREKDHLHVQLERSERERASLIEASERVREVSKYIPTNPLDGSDYDASSPIRELEHQVVLHRVHGDQYAQGIRHLSRQLLAEKFGAGPYHVELQMAFPDDAQVFALKGSRTGTILLELATAEEMPHTVYTFLSRVSQGLYDGCSFYHNAGHVIVAGALANLQTDANVDLKQRFVDAGLEQVHLQEYSTLLLHSEYTIGLAGRPGGTEFYINTRNNAVNHGPGGQVGYRDPSEADPCFAKVVRGFELVDRMRSIPDLMSAAARIAILSARIVK